MSRAGGVFYKNKDGKEYYTIGWSKELKHFIPQLNGLVFVMQETPIEKRKENSPMFEITYFKPDDE